jgi:transposase
MNMRELKALELAARTKIVANDDGTWTVPSQSTGGTYRVVTWPGAERCQCEDFELRAQPCKHIIAAKLVEEREGRRPAPPIDTETLPVKTTYTQDWPAYNHAQGIEKDRLQELLFDLCQTVDDPMRPGPGRKPHRKRDSVFGMVFKVYCLFSTRRFTSDLRAAHRAGYLSRPFKGMKVNQFMENPAFTPILKELLVRSSLPFRSVETDFAIDSSGFSTSKFERWYDHKYGVTRNRCLWVKDHICSGVKTNVVTAIRILDKDAGDCPQFAPLVKDTAKHFTIGEVSADKAYASVENFETVAECGGTGFMAFKNNATGRSGGLFEKMYHYFQFKRDEYLAHDHKRSNVESTFSMVKRKFGDSVRSRTDTAVTNEVLCKVVCYNLCCLIQEEAGLGIRPAFGSATDDGPRAVLPLVSKPFVVRRNRSESARRFVVAHPSSASRSANFRLS